MNNRSEVKRQLADLVGGEHGVAPLHREALDEHDTAGRPVIDLMSVLNAAEAGRVELVRIATDPGTTAAQAVSNASLA